MVKNLFLHNKECAVLNQIGQMNVHEIEPGNSFVEARGMQGYNVCHTNDLNWELNSHNVKQSLPI